VEKKMVLITGRTRAQAAGLHKGGGSPEHMQATSYADMSGDALHEMGLEPGGLVLVESEAGSIKLPVRQADMPDSLIFIPMGPSANILVGPDTYGTGMPSSKGVTVKVRPV
jgi:formylmethanofuran dehydrogenase subunit D